MHKIFLFLLLLTTIFSNQQAVCQKKNKPGISFLPADKSNVSVFIVLKDLANQRFLFTVPEIFTGKNLKEGLFNSDLQPWILKGAHAERSIKDSLYAYHINLQLHEGKTESRLDWIIRFENNSTSSLYDLAAFNCLTMHFAPMFKDTTMSRTWVKDKLGATMLLKNVQKTTGNGRRTMQFYHTKGGVEDLTTSTWINTWNVTSPDTLSGNTMWLESVDGKWKIETSVNRQTAYFFNNWEGDHGCIHASPLLARELKPGEKASASGSFRFIKK